MYKLDFQKVSIVGALLLALLALYVALSATTAPAPVAPVASTQSFACAPGTMCVQYGGKTVDMLSGSVFRVNDGAFITATNGIYIGTTGPFTATGPLTISGVISNVYLLTK